MDKNSYFWLGAGSSGAIYVMLLMLVFFTATQTPKKIQLAGQNIAVDMIMSESRSTTQRTATQNTVAQTIPAPKEESVPLKNVPEQKKDEKKPTLDDAKNILKKFETKPTQQQPKPESPKEVQSAKSILNSLTLKKNAPSVTFSSAGSHSNEYLGKIAGLIKAGWQPYKSDAGLTALISISIKVDGSFEYSIKKASPNSDFNERLNNYLKELKNRGFPLPEDKKPINVDFNFIAKE